MFSNHTQTTRVMSPGNLTSISGFQIERLNKDNYGVWKQKITQILKLEKLWSCLDDNIEVDVSDAKHKEINERALELIILSVDDMNISKLSSCESAKEAW